MNKGWLELESDPGLFTLLLEDFGVKGVQVEEIYDLQKAIDGPVYGFIFLFRWIEERRSRRKTITEEETFLTNDDEVNNLFFAQQVVPNSCATHALLSVLLNCDKVRLGDTLSKLKLFSRGMNPEDKGYAIGNMPELAEAHNSHARSEPRHLPEKQQGIATTKTMEAFHFVSYVPIKNHLFELDGLKPYPIDHGPWERDEYWTEKFRRVITERLGMAAGGEPNNDIRFNLMAVVPDKCQLYEHKLATLKTNRQIVLETLQQLLDAKMVKVTNPGLTSSDKDKYLAAVKQHEKMEEALIAQAQEDAAAKSAAKHNIAEKSLSNMTNSDQSQSSETSQDGSIVNITESHDSDNNTTVQENSSSESKIVPMDDENKVVNISENSEDIIIDVDSMETESDIKDNEKLSETIGNIKKDNFDSKIEIESKSDGFVEIESDSVTLTSACTESIEEPPLILSNKESLEGMQVTSSDDKNVKIQISVDNGDCGKGVTIPRSVASTDVTKPLTIETKFGGPSGPSSESTDTASEGGSCFSSPNTNSCQNSPVCSNGESTDMKKDTLSDRRSEGRSSDSSHHHKHKRKFHSHQAFTPKDLLALLKNVENEIKLCEVNLKDELEKRKKYRIDDCRRTHNYDEFICTFLSMLAKEGHLANLIDQQMSVKKRHNSGNAGRPTKHSLPVKGSRPKPKRRR
ncbi:ubiquitin carboxyl-terminal hydrolase calypso-like isoform X1 [Mytilus edulis]